MEKAHKHSMKKFRRAKVDLNQLDEEAALTLDETTSSMSGSQRWSRSTLNGDWPRGQHGEYVYGGQEYGGRYEEADHIYGRTTIRPTSCFHVRSDPTTLCPPGRVRLQ